MSVASELDQIAEKAGLGGTTPAPARPRAREPDGLGWGPEEGKAEPGIVKAHGAGEIRVSPDVLQVVLGAEAQGATLEEARQGAAAATQSFLAALRGQDIPGLQLETRQVSLYPVHARERNYEVSRLPKVVGYRACGSVSARIRRLPADKLAAVASVIVDTAAAHGANQIEGISFGVEHPEIPARDALRIAVEDARANAEVLAQASGTALGALHSLHADQDHHAGAYMLAAASAVGARSMGASTPIEAGEILVRRTVTGRWFFQGTGTDA
jgi:uncharacterized protein YggE